MDKEAETVVEPGASDGLEAAETSKSADSHSVARDASRPTVTRARSYSRRCTTVYEAAPDLAVSPLGAPRRQKTAADDVEDQTFSVDEGVSPCRQRDSAEPVTPSDWKSRFRSGLRHRVINFTPAWHAVNMGTGISSILLYRFPYPAAWLQYLGIAVWALNIVLFFILLGMSVGRYLVWPKIFGLMLRHPQQSLFLGTLPMGFDTIVSMFALVLGQRWATFTWTLYWIGVVLTAVIGFGVPFLMFTRQHHSVEGLSAIWLLPIVAFVVMASTGGLVASILPPSSARTTLIVSYINWGAGVPPAFLIMSLYLLRLSVHHVPPREQIVSVFLPLGPCGQGAYGAVQLGAMVRKLAWEDGVGLLGDAATRGPDEAKTIASAVYGVSIIVALVLYGFGWFWLVSALTLIADMARKGGFPFNMGWWGFTFPLGVFALATITFANEFGSEAFRVLGALLATCEILLWLYIATRTAIRAVTGTMFVAPCLQPYGGQPPCRTQQTTDA